jgi:predicted NUDIX family phosphoesterase
MKILCIKKELLPSKWISGTSRCRDNFFEVVTPAGVSWIERAVAEADETFCQIIPYILIKNDNEQFFTYPRHGSEQRLSGFYSFGLGGHIEESDWQGDIQQTIEHGLLRELSEELSNFQPDNINLVYQGIINEVESEVGRVHLGLVYLAKCKHNYIPIPAEETKGAKWVNKQTIPTLKKELWSELAIQLIKSNL